MRFALALLSVVMAAEARAGGGVFGTAQGPTGPERQVRIGSSSKAVPFEDYAVRGPPQGTHVTAVLLYVTSVEHAGTFKIDVLNQSGQPPLTSATASAQLAAPGWVQWTFGEPVNFKWLERLRLSPVGPAEATFGHLTHDRELDNQTGEDEGDGAHLYAGRVDSRFSGPAHDVSMIFRLHGVDPFASPSCARKDRDALSGFPYVHERAVALREGETRMQRTVLPKGVSGFNGVTELILSNRAAAVSIRVTHLDGGLLGAASSDGRVEPHFGVPPDADAGHSIPFLVGVSPDGGAAQWPVFDVGEGLSECHPAVRAGFGGHLARAEGEPNGSDFFLRIWPCTTTVHYRDRDQDGSGDPSTTIDACGLPDGFVDNSRDCDDTRDDLHAGRAENCDGIDNDCDGLTDEQDPGLRVDLHCMRTGVCARSRARCVAGVWGLCDYGPSYSPVELACDGLDNNCDGLIDSQEPNVSSLCEKQLGVCAGSGQFPPQCVDGHPAHCEPPVYGLKYQPDEYFCDGLDNDCDGEVDEGCVPTAQPARSCGCSAGGDWLGLVALAFLGRRRARR